VNVKKKEPAGKQAQNIKRGKENVPDGNRRRRVAASYTPIIAN
jgi:hypothetical protein